MSWLFWVVLVVLAVFVIHGCRKGLLKTVISMVSTLAVILITSWLTPHIGAFIRENTQWQESIQIKIEETLFAELDAENELSDNNQSAFIEELPLPQIMKDALIENNNAEIYEKFDVDDFSEYLSGYIARGIINGIVFIIAFIATLIIMRLIVHAVNILTSIPVIGTLDHLGGGIIGLVHGIFWIAIFFLIVVICCDTKWGSALMNTINSDPMLSWIYDKNVLIQIIMKIME